MRQINTLVLEDAKEAFNAMEKECLKLKLECSFCIMDCMGNVILMEKMDNACKASLVLAEEKALSALQTFLPTRELDGIVKEKNVDTGYFEGAFKTPVWGGLPVFGDKNDKIPAGAIGVSGGSWEQDELIAYAGIKAMNLSGR